MLSRSATEGVVGVRRIASEFADIWCTLLADVKHVAPADRLFQRTTKARQFDISTSMLFLTYPKHHVPIVHGLRNHFPNTMFGGVLLWTLIEVLLRNMRSPYSFACDVNDECMLACLHMDSVCLTIAHLGLMQLTLCGFQSLIGNAIGIFQPTHLFPLLR